MWQYNNNITDKHAHKLYGEDYKPWIIIFISEIGFVCLTYLAIYILSYNMLRFIKKKWIFQIWWKSILVGEAVLTCPVKSLLIF